MKESNEENLTNISRRILMSRVLFTKHIGGFITELRSKELDLTRELILNAQQIGLLLQDHKASACVGGKNENCAILTNIPGVNTAKFRAVTATAYNLHLDTSMVNQVKLDAFINDAILEYNIGSKEQPSFIRDKGLEYRQANNEKNEVLNIALRQYINNRIEATKQIIVEENIDQNERYKALQALSIASQIAIMSVDMPANLKADIATAYEDVCDEVGKKDLEVAVRSSAVGEDSADAAFAGAQDTYLNIKGSDTVVLHVQRDFASGFNIRSLEYRLSQIDEAINSGTPREQALKSFDFNNIAVSVVIQQMIKSQIAGTAFSIDPSSGMDNVVSIDANFGYGETVVGGIVTPDNFLVTKDGKLIVKTLGPKDVMMVNKETGTGTMEIKTPAEKVFAWTLSDDQVRAIADMVKRVESHYGIYMDTEFAIDDTGLYLVQARPETKHSKQAKENPGVIPMKTKEVAEKDFTEAVKVGKVLLKGDGASKGAATGKVVFVDKITPEVFTRFKKGDILVAERTDPDFLPLFKLAGAVVANVGGRTSHAAITSRELSIPAVIGVNNIEALKAMNGKIITVDGTRGSIIEGELDLVEAGKDIDTLRIKEQYPTKTAVGLILADVDAAKELNSLKNIPDFKVGLLRAEFVLGAIGVHYKALKAYDAGVFNRIVTLAETGELEKTLAEISQKKDTIANISSTGIHDVELISEEEGLLYDMVTIGLDKFQSRNELLENVKEIKSSIEDKLKISGYKSGKEFYVEMLSQRVALFARSFEGKDVIYRTTDYKSNEYEGLTGGVLFEGKEDNPMIGYRGVSRGIDTWEIEAFKKARTTYGATNLHIMLPFVRKESEIAATSTELRTQLSSNAGKGLKIFVMAEVPSVARNPHAYLRYVDGFSIGSNDLTQGYLMTDRDSARLQGTYDEEDPALVEATLAIIFSAIKEGKEVGYCGMGVSNSPLIAGMVSIAGITSASATPDVYVKVKEIIHGIEQQGVSVEKLGEWIQKYTEQKMVNALDELDKTGLYTFGTNFSKGFSPKEAYNWVSSAYRIASEQTYNIDEEKSLRGKLSQKLLLKVMEPIIKANQHYSEIVNKALNTAGFASAQEYSMMLENRRNLEEKIEQIMLLISKKPEFDHSTTFRNKISYLYSRIKTIDSHDQRIKKQAEEVKKASGPADYQSKQAELERLQGIKQQLIGLKHNILYWAEKYDIK